MNRYFILILFTVVAQALASLFSKYAALFLNKHGIASTIYNPFFFAMFTALGIQTIAWQTALRHFPLNYAYMFMSLTYPLILGLSFFFLGETISAANIAGTLIIMTGVLILVYGKKEEHD